MALAALRVSERVEKRCFGAICARSGAGMSLSAARTQMCVPADSLGVIDHSAQSCSWVVLYWQTAARCERPGRMRRPNPRRSCPRADDRVSRGTRAASCRVLIGSQREAALILLAPKMRAPNAARRSGHSREGLNQSTFPYMSRITLSSARCARRLSDVSHLSEHVCRSRFV